MNQRFSFQTGWKFLPDFRPQAIEADYPPSLLAAWEDVSLPHTLRLEPYRNGTIPTHQGLGMYRKHFRVEEALRDKLLYLEFEAVMGTTDVWLNGHLLHTKFADAAPDPDGTVHTNCGGYLPFVVELTPYLRYDADNILVVLADNRDNGQLPPGKPQELLDFTYFGGIYRSVWLDVCEKVHITNSLRENLVRGGGVVFEITALSEERADVLVRTHIRNCTGQSQDLRLCVCLDGRAEAAFPLEGGQDIELTLPLTVTNPRLWSPDHPNLYELSCTLFQGETLLHRHRETIGLRQITVSRTEGVLLNGKRLPLLSGVNRHQDFPLIGNAAPAALQREDAVLYKSAGFNVVRSAHYPMSVEFLKACDELGILLLEATPGWQWYPVGADQPFTLRVHQNIRQMVRRDRNHPCILAYETVLNETYHVPQGYTRRMEEIALEESADARIAAESYGYDTAVNGVDDLADFIYGFQDPLEKTTKALQFHREYGDSWQEAYGHRMSRRVTRGDCDSEYPGGPRENLLKANNLLFDHRDDIDTLADCRKAYLTSPAFAGGAIWTGIDSRGMWSKVSPCGIWDPFRLPKTSYYAFASQRPVERNPRLDAMGVETGPVVHIADPLENGETHRDVYVYSNGCQVALQAQVNGECFYSCRLSPMDEGLCAWLEHPPFLFRDVPWKEGSSLTATAFDRDGQILAVSRQLSPGKPRRIRLRASDRVLLADGSDIIPVYCEIIDGNGTICPRDTHSVYLTLEGDGQILGDSDCLAAANPSLTEAGIAAFYIRTGTTPGHLTILAECTGLECDRLVLNLAAPTIPEFPFTTISKGTPDPICSRNLADKLISGGTTTRLKHRGIWYPNSILLEEQSQFRLPEGSTRLYGRISMKRSGVLHLLADGAEFAVISRSGPFCVNLPKASRLTLRAPQGAKLLSPFLSDEPLSLQDTRKNLVVKCRCTASSHQADAGNVMKKGHLWETMWVGDPIDGNPEYFQVDLGRCFDIQDVMVYIGGQMGSDCTNYTYEIHTSQDGSHWEVQTRTRRTSWSNGSPDRFRAASVRYVRVVFLRVDGGLLPALSKIHVYEEESHHEKGEES